MPGLAAVEFSLCDRAELLAAIVADKRLCFFAGLQCRWLFGSGGLLGFDLVERAVLVLLYPVESSLQVTTSFEGKGGAFRVEAHGNELFLVGHGECGDVV